MWKFLLIFGVVFATAAFILRSFNVQDPRNTFTNDKFIDPRKSYHERDYCKGCGIELDNEITSDINPEYCINCVTEV
jgi:hypothetical protein